ncbi:GTPase IMAP family member 7-like [Centroberyx gerrardi]
MNPDSMSDTEQENPRGQPEVLRIMLLGKSGAGKSSSGNNMLGREEFKSDMKLKRVTPHCEKAVGEINDKPIAVIDTPGLFETVRKKEEIVREILKSVKLQEPGPHVFVVVVPLGRMTQEDQDTNAVIETKFGPKVWDYTIVLFTHGDRLEGKTINDVISESDENLRNFIRKCSGGFHVFNNKDQGNQKQVKSFLKKIQTLVALNGGGYYRTEFYPAEERTIRERQESFLAERDEAISREETKLQEHYQGKELVEEKRKLWRKEEEKARADAERETKNMSKVRRMVAFAVAFLVCLALVVPQVWVLVGGIGLFWILQNRYSTTSAQMRQDVKNKQK